MRCRDVIEILVVLLCSISNRALVIRAIQRCLMSPLHTEKAVLYSAACNILCGTYGRELSLLKEQIHADEEAFIDESGELAFEERPGEERLSLKDSYKDPPHSGDLIHLIYANKNLTEVVKVVQHIAVESLAVKEEEPHLVKVVSDIDDTLFAGYVYPLRLSRFRGVPTDWLVLADGSIGGIRFTSRIQVSPTCMRESREGSARTRTANPFVHPSRS